MSVISELGDTYWLILKVNLGLLSSYYVYKNSFSLFFVFHTIASFFWRCSLWVCDEVMPFPKGTLLFFSFPQIFFFFEGLTEHKNFQNTEILKNLAKCDKVVTNI